MGGTPGRRRQLCAECEYSLFVTSDPLHGWTSSGHAVHGTVADHLPTETLYQRFNKRVALWVTRNVGTMTCGWIFAVIALISLPAAISTHNVIVIVAWVAQTFLQLVLLSVIMVGQQIQDAASDARAAKTFEDVAEIKEMVSAFLQEKTK